jgi:hypothetical protein
VRRLIPGLAVVAVVAAHLQALAAICTTPCTNLEQRALHGLYDGCDKHGCRIGVLLLPYGSSSFCCGPAEPGQVEATTWVIRHALCQMRGACELEDTSTQPWMFVPW